MNPMEFLQKKVAPDEPVFILRAQDMTAPGIIEVWADNIDSIQGKRTPKTIEARGFAKEMRDWQARNHAKVPD